MQMFRNVLLKKPDENQTFLRRVAEFWKFILPREHVYYNYEIREKCQLLLYNYAIFLSFPIISNKT